MSHGAADDVGKLIGQNIVNLTQKEWEQAALSGRGIYKPIFRNENEFHQFALGPKITINENGIASMTGDAGGVESLMLSWADNKSLFMKKIGREADPIPNHSLGNSRAEILANLFKYSEKERRGRDLDYVLVATGGLKPWAKQLSDGIDKIESKNVINKGAIAERIRGVIADRPLLRTVISNAWKKDVDNGKMTRYEYEKRTREYLEGY